MNPQSEPVAEVEISVLGTDNPLNVRDFAKFLINFRMVYAVASELSRSDDWSALLERLSGLGPDRFERYFNSELGDEELVLTYIEKNSPLKMKLKGGKLVALLVTIFLTGGDIKYKDGTFDCHVNGIIESFEKLEKLFKPRGLNEAPPFSDARRAYWEDLMEELP